MLIGHILLLTVCLCLRSTFAQPLIQQHGVQEYAAEKDLLQKGIHVGQVEAVVEDADGDGAEQRAAKRAFAVEEAGLSDHYGRDHVQLNCNPALGIPAPRREASRTPANPTTIPFETCCGLHPD